MLLDVYQSFNIVQQQFPMRPVGRNHGRSPEIGRRICDLVGLWVPTPPPQRSRIGGLWKKLISHKSVRRNVPEHRAGSGAARQNRPIPSKSGGVTYERYRGSWTEPLSSVSEDAYAPFPRWRARTSSCDSPADYMETVNTDGAAYYTRV